MGPKKFLPYAQQSITEGDIKAVSEALRASWITRGPKVTAFEAAVAEYCGAQFAVAFNSGTSALYAAYAAVRVSSFDRVISTPNTFIATVGPGFKAGSRVIFLDIDPNTGSLDLHQLELNINQDSTRGKTIVVPVHFAGAPLNMAAIEAMVKKPETVIIEDGCHALGATYLDGRRVGCCAWSHATVFSFHPAKGVTTGEGGIVTTNDEEMAHRLRQVRNNGLERDITHQKNPCDAPWYYEVQEISWNFHMTDMQAALGISQMKRLDKFIEKRRTLVAHYRERLQDMPIEPLTSEETDSFSAHNLFVVRVPFQEMNLDRKDFMLKLQKDGIGTQVHYIPIYRMPFLEAKEDLTPYFPATEHYYAEALSLPLFYDMTKKDVDRVADALEELALVKK